MDKRLQDYFNERKYNKNNNIIDINIDEKYQITNNDKRTIIAFYCTYCQTFSAKLSDMPLNRWLKEINKRK